MKNKLNSGLIMGGCTMLGMGLGYLTGNIRSFLFIGIGIGLVMAYFMPIIFKNSDHESE